MTRQHDKYQLAIAGEFFVAAQLQRMGVSASVTYGHAKRADVIAVSRATGRAISIEVKTSSKSRWPVGNRVPQPSEQPWVFVHMPVDRDSSPEFFVLLQSELHTALAPGEAQYLEKFKARNGKEYGDKTPGVAAAKLTDVAQFKNNWECITRLLDAQPSAPADGLRPPLS